MPELVFRYARVLRLRWLISGAPVIALFGLSLAYMLRGSTASAGSTLALLDSTYIYPVIFPVVFVLMVGALVFKRFISESHVVGAAVLSGYFIAIVYTAGVQHASTGWITAALALSVAFSSFVSALIYAKGE